MIFPEDVLTRLGIFVLGFCGFLVARHIHNHKNSNKAPLVCPIRFDCNTVVHSDYSKLLGIPVEIFGMLYYSLVAISYFAFIFMPFALPLYFTNFIIILSLFAFFFSVYLIGIQIFVLKKGCSWCIVSAIISACIFILTILTYHLSYIIGIFTQ